MKPKWLLESDVFHENLPALVEEIRHQGMEVTVLTHVPFLDVNAFQQGVYGPYDCVIVYGSLNFAESVRQLAWVPGVYYNKNAYKCSAYYPKLAQYNLLNNDYVLIPYGDLLRQRDFLLRQIGEQGCVFIRPDSGSKIFTGRLVSGETFSKDVEYFCCQGAQQHDLCVVSSPKNVESEWRFVAVKQDVIAGSQYIKYGQLDVEASYPYEALELAQRVAKSGYQPDSVWCIDICRTRMGNYYLLEIGCFSCAGLYACDLEVIVREVSKVAKEEWINFNN